MDRSHSPLSVTLSLGTRPRRAASVVLKGAVLSSLLVGLGAVSGGCLSRPVEACDPSTKTSFQTNVKQTAVDKVDLLFAIDNSQSMGDKQTLLARAVPDLVNRLLTPNCVDEADKAVGVSTLDANGDAQCATGKPEFPAVHDLHIGIITSALGGGGSDRCAPNELIGDGKRLDKSLNAHNDDKGQLINRAGLTEGPVPNMGASNYLAWLPTNKKNTGKPDPAGTSRITEQTKLQDSFQQMIEGVHEYGCGYEAQLESVYRFLVQPDPYANITKEANIVRFNGVDETLLKQRADFLRPDSLVAVIMLTDENESTVDPRSLGGQGWRYADSQAAAKPTSICATAPADPKCGPCLVSTFFEADPACKTADGKLAKLDGASDRGNVRFARMKERFGFDPRYPVERYIDGFRKEKVPNRDEEHPASGAGYEEYRVGGGSCTNPLFAAGPLPTGASAELCKLPIGPRTADQVFFALIGGLPWQILTDGVGEDITKVAANATFKTKLDAGDWTRILGADPSTYNETGQNIFMKESIDKRAGIADGNPINTKEWDVKTNGQDRNDLQYACTFKLPAELARDCPSAADGACVCGQNNDAAQKTDNPLCDPAKDTKQIQAKAYPTLQQLRVVKALGEQGIVSSICPRDLSDQASENYGYRPAVRAIIDRLRNALNNQCLPQKLVDEKDPSADKDNIPCLILEQLPKEGTEADCAGVNRTVPSAEVLKKYRDEQAATLGKELAEEQKKFPVCLLPQIKEADFGGPTCEGAANPGWCYLTRANAGAAIGKCEQAIKFSKASQNVSGSKISLQCLEKAPLLVDENDPRKDDPTKNLDCTAK